MLMLMLILTHNIIIINEHAHPLLHSLNSPPPIPHRHVSPQLHSPNHPLRRLQTLLLRLNTLSIRPPIPPPRPIRLPPPHRLLPPSPKHLPAMLDLFPILHQPIRTNLQHSLLLRLPNQLDISRLRQRHKQTTIRIHRSSIHNSQHAIQL